MINLNNKINIELNDEDRAIIESYKNVVIGIANLLGDNCEVLVHSLENYEKSVNFIKNGHNSGRNKGAPITDLALKLINNLNINKSFLEPYESKFPNGDRCKSVTIPIKNREKLIGLLCINLNMEVSIFDFAKHIILNNNDDKIGEEVIENYSSNIDDMMKFMLEKIINDIIINTSIPNQDKNKTIILKLYEVGFFQLKGSVEALAEKLQISPHTIYSNIRKYT